MFDVILTSWATVSSSLSRDYTALDISSCCVLCVLALKKGLKKKKKEEIIIQCKHMRRKGEKECNQFSHFEVRGDVGPESSWLGNRSGLGVAQLWHSYGTGLAQIWPSFSADSITLWRTPSVGLQWSLTAVIAPREDQTDFLLVFFVFLKGDRPNPRGRRISYMHG